MTDDNRRIDLLKFASSWIFFSITTALGLSSILEDEGVGTPIGVWDVLVNLYSAIMGTIFGSLAFLFPFDWFEITTEESNSLGVLVLVFLPLAAAKKERSMLIFLVIAVLVLAVMMGIRETGAEWWLFGLSMPLVTFVVLFVLFGWEAWKERKFLPYSRNLLGAALILLGLMATGWFEIRTG